jgi:hypothetical protein
VIGWTAIVVFVAGAVSIALSAAGIAALGIRRR